MTNKEQKAVAKKLAKELKKSIKTYKPRERIFPLDDAIRYELSEEELQALNHGILIDEATATITLEVDPQ